MEAKQTLYKAIAAFQQEVPVIHKATKAFKYSYADLPTVLDIINPLLKKHGLGFTQLIVNENLVTRVFHIESGEYIESNVYINSKVQLGGMNEFQVMGSAITYLRRYSLSAMLGLVTDVDTDANGVTQKEPVKTEIQETPTKPIMSNAHKQWGKLQEKLSNGEITIEQIKDKFTLSEQTEKQLSTLIPKARNNEQSIQS